MKTMRLSLAAFACATGLVAGIARAAPPDQPVLIYDAAPKQVLLDWNYVPRANWYEIWFQANSAAAWAKLGERPSWYPHRDVNVSAHLLHWAEMRWDVRACNPSGCSTPRSIDIGSTVVNTVGYVKPTQPQANAGFGAALDVSEDGKTLAVVASREPMNADPDSGTATIYVYRGSPNNWKQEARLRPSRAQIGNGRNVTVSLSGDGNLLLVGVPHETFLIDQGEPDSEHGVAYLFRRSGDSWSQVRAFMIDGGDIVHIGRFVKLSDDGKTLAIGMDSYFGAKSMLWVYRDTPAGWVIYNSVELDHLDQFDFNLSGDGQRSFVRWRDGTDVRIQSYDVATDQLRDMKTITVPVGYELSSFDVDSTGNTIVNGVRPSFVSQASYDPALWKPTVTVYRHDGTTYQGAFVLRPSIHQPTSYAKRTQFGDRVAISSAGSYVAVYDPHDAWATNGVQRPPTSAYDAEARGSIYLFEKNGTGYRQRRHIGANGGVPDYVDGLGIFGPLSFGNDGKTFAAGSPQENGGIGGIKRMGDAATGDNSAPDAGAVWLY
jgi:hypothetical protein